MTVSRANIQLASLPTASLGVLLASRSKADVIDAAVVCYVVFFFLVLSYSCQVNCLHDLEVDDRAKPHFSGAVRAIGIRRLNIIIWVELAAAVGLVLAIVWMKREAIYLWLALGIGIGHAYSAPPLRIKKRGVLSPLPVMLGLYFLPIAAGGFLVLGRISGFVVLFGLGYALVMEGITLVNTCEDFVEDRESGIATWAHLLGVRRALRAGAISIASGGLMIVGLLLPRILTLAQRQSLFAFAALLGFVFLTAVYRSSRSLLLLSRASNPVLGSKRIALYMPRWFFWTRYPLFLMSLIFLV